MTIDLSRSPVPIENLTTQVPEEAKNYKMMFNNRSVLQRASAKVYAINSKVNGVIWDPTYAAGQGIKCDYLVPVNFVGRDNAIPCSAVNVSGYSFSHIGGLLTDSTEGGIGDGVTIGDSFITEHNREGIGYLFGYQHGIGTT